MPPATDTPRGFTFFFYGTLCDADVRATVIGRAVAGEPATLADSEAVPAERGRFPILLFRRGQRAEGIVCHGVTLDEAARLACYEHEGRDYTARPLDVRDGAGTEALAWVFVPTRALRRGPGRWDLAQWQRFAKRVFLARVRRHLPAGIEPEALARYRAIWSKRAQGGPAVMTGGGR